MKHDDFQALWADPRTGGKTFNIARDLRVVVAQDPRRMIYEIGEIVITSNYYNDATRDTHWYGTNVGIATPDEAPQLRLLDGTEVPVAWLKEADVNAQMLLLDYDHRVAIRLLQVQRQRYYQTDFAYYPTKGALPVPNVPILVSQPDRKAALRANKRLKVLQGVANFRIKALGGPLPKPSTTFEKWVRACTGDADLEAVLAEATIQDCLRILMVDSKQINKACRIVTEHTYLKF